MKNSVINMLSALVLLTSSAATFSASAQDSSSKPARATTSSTTPIMRGQVAEKPDYTIVAAKPMGAKGNYRVTVKNMGGAHHAEMVLWGTHTKGNGQSWGAATNIKTVFGAGEQKYIDIKFAPGEFDRGDRILFEVDYYKAVAESNEKNNKFSAKI